MVLDSRRHDGEQQPADKQDGGPLDLTSCENEPIRTPGLIQPHGVLLAIDPTSLIIEQVSENCELVLGRTPRELIGESPQTFLGQRQFEELTAALSRAAFSGSTNVVAGPQQQRMDCIYSRFEDTLLLELHPGSAAPRLDLLAASLSVEAPLARMDGSAGIDGLVQTVAKEIRTISGFDRVMVYRFDEDWHGVVLAEEVSERLPVAYLGLHFPASDIPAVARDLYLLNTLRLIPDIEYIPVAIVPARNPRLAAALDLSRSELRSVSPIHLQYLRNIGVRATLTISIVMRGKLWGLVACHHDSPRQLDHAVRSTCGFFAQMLALKLTGRIDNAALAERLERGERIANFVAGLNATQSIAEALSTNWQKLLPIFAADALFVHGPADTAVYGTALSAADLSPVIRKLREAAKVGIASSSSLARLEAMSSAGAAEMNLAHSGVKRFAREVSGALYIGLCATDDRCLVILRREQSASVKWAGDPNKPAYAGGQNGSLTPRASFEIWEETVRYTSIRWSLSDLETAANLRDQLVRRQRARDDIRVLTHDALTELPNRRLLDDILKRLLHEANAANTRLALLFIDIDRLKRFNDRLGYSAGDRVLRHVAACLLGAVREGDIVGRHGADEFVIIMPAVADRTAAENLAQHILNEVSRPMPGFEVHDLRVTLSIGISMYPTDGSTSGALLGAADAAMYYVKKNGRGAWRSFERGRPDPSSRMPERARRVTDAALSLRPPGDEYDVFELTRTELDELPFGVITLDRQGKILRFNLAEGKLARLAAHSTIGLDFFADVAPCTNVQEFRGRFDDFAAKYDAGVDRFDFSYSFRWGREDVSIALLRKAARSDINIIVRGHLMSESPDWAAHERQRLAATPQELPSDAGVAMATHSAGYLQPPAGYRLGSADEAAARDRIHADDAAAVAELVAAAVLDRRSYTIEYRTLRPGGFVALVQECGVFPVEAREPGFATLLDVSARRQTEENNRRAAYYDDLTGLPNRALLVLRIAEAVAQAEISGRIAAVLVLNIDKFREINDQFGYDIGTRLLPSFALRLGECVRAGDTVARLDGDRFAILLTDVETGLNVAAAVSGLIAAVARTFILDERPYHLTLSAGISVAPYDGRDPNALLCFADAAMSEANADGRNGFRWYDSAMSVDAAKVAQRHNELRTALEKNELELHYQPVVDVATDRIVAAEALVRWNHPTRGFLGPGEFIALADRTGLIVPLGEWVLREACRQAGEWESLGFQLRVCVNVSAVQFRQPNFCALVASILAETGLSASRLELELTESIMVDGFGVMMEVLTRLKSLGVRLSIDDFGTGYSSLSYLKYFPVDTLKIDRAFIIDIAFDQLDRAIATAVFTLASELHLDCVVEGVENIEQLETVRVIGCSLIQGYYFSKPVPGAKLRAILGQPVAAMLPSI
jgi:photoactive yellow protein